MKILILNPPSAQKHLRGNYCSNVSKGAYYYPAIDLLVQSGILGQRFEISVCDAIAEELSEEEVLGRVGKERVEGIYAVTGSSSRLSDLAFFRRAKEQHPSLRILLSGGYLLTQAAQVFSEAPWIDGALLDFTSDESVPFFEGKNGPFEHLALPERPMVVSKRGKSKAIHYPTPRHELFPLKSYDHPNARHHPFSVLLHSSGCPYRCNYCIYSVTPYEARPVEDVVEELRYLRSIGVREAFFHDPTFAVKREDGLALCNAMIRAELKMGWFCQTRVDLMDEELLTAMRNAGCHAIMFGVESADDQLLKDEHERTMNHAQTRQVFSLCQKLKIRTLSYLVIGLPGDTEESIAKTVDFVKEIQSDFVSFNLAIPVIGTGFRDQVISQGMVSEDLIEFDNSSEDPAIATRYLNKMQLARAHQNAVRKFYFRPRYLLRRLASVRSLYELRNHLREGVSLAHQFMLSQRSD